MPVPRDCGEDKLSGAAEHPRVRRLRHRRLLAYLWLQGFEATFGSFVQEAGDFFFSVVHLQGFIKQGQWRDAIGYLSRFLPFARDRLGVEAQVLHRFLMVLRFLDDLVDGCSWSAEAALIDDCRSLDRDLSRGALRIRCMMLTALHRWQQLRELDWELVRHKASDIVYDLVHSAPELSSFVQLPAGPMIKPHTVLPVRLISSRRQMMCNRKKQRYRRHPYALANSYLRKRRRLLSPIHFQEPQRANAEVVSRALDWVADILDECLKAGEYKEHDKEDPLQTGAASAPAPHAMLGNMTGPARNPGMPSVATVATSAPVSQTMFATLTAPVRNLGTPSAANTAVTKGNIALTMLGAPVSQPVFGSLTSPAESSGVPFKTNAGTTNSLNQKDKECQPGLQSNGGARYF